MCVRDAFATDAAAMGRVHVAAWQVAYRGLMPDAYLDGLSAEDRARMWREALSAPPRPRSARFVSERGVDVVGFITVGPAAGDEDAVEGEVYALNVEPGRWGVGVGRALLDAGTAHLRAAGFAQALLWVVPGNARARAFYEAAGWRADGAERDDEVLGVRVAELRYRRRLDPSR